MRWNARPPVVLLVGLGLMGATGCQSAGDRFLSLIGLQKDPLVVALVAARQRGPAPKPLEVLNPFAPYGPWREALREELGRPVPLDLCFPFQLEPALKSGMVHLAVVSTAQYVGLPDREHFVVVAVPTDEQGRAARPALLIVATHSAIGAVEDLRGKIVAFGPAGDARTHQAGLELLARHGIKKTDLSLELLPLPGSLKHMPNMRSVARSVMNASSDAGFIDQAAWEALPEATADEDEPARDKFNVVAQTVAVPDRLILASPKLDEATIEKVRAILLSAAQDHPDVLTPLLISGYQAPNDELLEACGRLVEPESAAATAP